MRRIALVFALLAALLAPASASAAVATCSLTISPTEGAPTDAFRFSVTNVPVDPDGGSVEVRIDIRRLGTREGSIIFAFLIPGVTEFFVDYNVAPPGEPAETLVAGRYLVDVSTPHLHGACRAVGRFSVA
jgi:hypothetical protein